MRQGAVEQLRENGLKVEVISASNEEVKNNIIARSFEKIGIYDDVLDPWVKKNVFKY